MNPDQLRTIRERLGLTQSQLAERLQVSRITVTRWETGVITIDERTRLAIEHLSCRHRKP